LGRISISSTKSLALPRGSVELESPLPPDVLLTRLTALRRGGRPPYQCPAPLDQAGIRVRVDGNRFYLVGGTIFGRRTSYRPAWRGTIEPGPPESGGSRVRVEAGPSLKTIITWCVFLAWLVVRFLYRRIARDPCRRSHPLSWYRSGRLGTAARGHDGSGHPRARGIAGGSSSACGSPRG
jgi:hypothetical protein